MKLVSTALFLGLGLSTTLLAQEPTPAITPAIGGVVAAGTRIELIKEGFQGTEGPITLPDGSAIFTETQANRITRIAADGSTSSYLENTNGANGLAFNKQGELVAVLTGKPSIDRDRDGATPGFNHGRRGQFDAAGCEPG